MEHTRKDRHWRERRHIALSGLLPFLVALAVSAHAVDMGDLAIPSSRIPDYYPAAVAEANYLAAQSWPEYDATCANAPCPSGKSGFRDAPGDPMSGCTAADPANDGGEDWDNLNCMVDRAPDSSVVFVPDGRYDMGNASFEMITISRNNIVIRGESRAQTHLVATTHDGTNGRRGAANCTDNNCWSMIISAGAPYRGTSVAWTGGYNERTTTVTVANTSGLSVGGWIELAMTNCPALIMEPSGPADGSLAHLAKIVSISGSTVTIDRGLRMDYDDDGCQGSAIARSYSPYSGIGIENLHLTTDPNSLPQSKIGNGRSAFSMGGIVESWAVSNHLERFEDEIIRFQFSARNWVQGNIIEDFCYDSSSGFNTEGVLLNRGAVDNVIENNYGTDFCVFTKMHGGPEGNIFAYNYLPTGTPIRSAERTFFNHGMYTREMLFEGNDINHRLLIGDHWWGSQGPRNTAFRNRVRGSKKSSAIITNHDKDGPWLIAEDLNIIGNTAHYYLQEAASNSDFPDRLSDWHDIDHWTTGMWIEKNMYRDTRTCSGDETSNRCGFHMDSPEPSTRCGAELCTANGLDPGDNAGGDRAPASWASDAVPHSLYRGPEPPSWWCEEACSWSDVHQSIGAWGDDFDQALCKLPAQIMAEQGVCTPVGGVGTPQALSPPVLLE